MFFDEWNVLVVDDEPDVLAVTKLALRDVKVYGVPVRIYMASSKSAAIELLKGPLAMTGVAEPLVAVALIDVVMENDRAGLELCNHIRNQLGGHSVQLYIRTGQPGIAPERKVIDDYDISGYFTKVELSEQKLYTLVKSGVRQWFSNWYSSMTAATNARLTLHSTSRKEYLEAIGWFGEPGPREGEGVTGFLFDKSFVVSDYPDAIKPLHDRLDVLKPLIKTPEGHKLAMDDMGNILVQTVKTRTTADYYYVAESAMIMPRPLLDLTFNSGLVFSTLWKRITEAEKSAARKPVRAKRAKPAKSARKAAKKSLKRVANKRSKR